MYEKKYFRIVCFLRFMYHFLRKLPKNQQKTEKMTEVGRTEPNPFPRSWWVLPHFAEGRVVEANAQKILMNSCHDLPMIIERFHLLQQVVLPAFRDIVCRGALLKKRGGIDRLILLLRSIERVTTNIGRRYIMGEGEHMARKRKTLQREPAGFRTRNSSHLIIHKMFVCGRQTRNEYQVFKKVWVPILGSI